MATDDDFSEQQRRFFKLDVSATEQLRGNESARISSVHGKRAETVGGAVRAVSVRRQLQLRPRSRRKRGCRRSDERRQWWHQRARRVASGQERNPRLVRPWRSGCVSGHDWHGRYARCSRQRRQICCNPNRRSSARCRWSFNLRARVPWRLQGLQPSDGAVLRCREPNAGRGGWLGLRESLRRKRRLLGRALGRRSQGQLRLVRIGRPLRARVQKRKPGLRVPCRHGLLRPGQIADWLLPLAMNEAPSRAAQSILGPVTEQSGEPERTTPKAAKLKT